MSTRVITAARSGRAMRFGIVGLSGLIVNQVEIAGLHYLASAALATQVSSSWNFVATERWVFASRQPASSAWNRYGLFLLLNNATLLVRIPILAIMTDLLGIHYLWSNAITLAALFVVRFALADGWIWAAGSGARATRAVPADGPITRYDVAGVLRIDSEVQLKELAYFATDATTPPDLVIRVSRVGSMPARRTRFVSDDADIAYLEQLGAASANFRITMGTPITVQVAPLLASSPHVLYTNVVEALLRFLMVSRGHVLLHSAAMMVNGQAVLLSAQTDTGKTSTVIQLVRDRHYRFLSDDMTIVSPDGMAIHYPKPMTLSFHTMSAIRGHRLPKSGRTVGRRLGTMNIPIMSLNSVVQWLVPPPKYHIDALMPCDLAERAPIGHVFIMERGRQVTRRLSVESALGTLIENTDDAYGFPPFATFAPHIQIGSDDYGSLRQKEVALLKSALARAAIYRVRTPGHEWGEVIPSIVEGRPMLVGEPIEVGAPDYERPRLMPVPIVTESQAIAQPEQVRSDTA